MRVTYFHREDTLVVPEQSRKTHLNDKLSDTGKESKFIQSAIGRLHILGDKKMANFERT